MNLFLRRTLVLNNFIGQCEDPILLIAVPFRTETILVTNYSEFSSVKNYMSLHVLPMYVSTILYEKYKGLLKEANFQKGCINFKNKDEMPLQIVKDLIADCSKIDLRVIRENHLKSKSKKT